MHIVKTQDHDLSEFLTIFPTFSCKTMNLPMCKLKKMYAKSIDFKIILNFQYKLSVSLVKNVSLGLACWSRLGENYGNE